MSEDLYKDLYAEEWVRRDQLQSAVAVPVGLLTLLGGGLIVYTHKYDAPPSLSSVFFWCCIAVAVGCYAWAVILLVRSYHGYTYERLPWASQIREHHQGLLRFHAATGGTVEQANLEFGEFLRDRYIEATDLNSRNNARRGALLYEANRWIVISLVLMTLAAVPFALSERKQAGKIYKVQIVPQEKAYHD